MAHRPIHRPNRKLAPRRHNHLTRDEGYDHAKARTPKSTRRSRPLVDWGGCSEIVPKSIRYPRSLLSQLTCLACLSCQLPLNYSAVKQHFYSVPFYTPSDQRVLPNLFINVYVKYNFILYYIPWCLYPQTREACRINRINNPILF